MYWEEHWQYSRLIPVAMPIISMKGHWSVYSHFYIHVVKIGYKYISSKMLSVKTLIYSKINGDTYFEITDT